jgi:hypothetical protein
MNKHVAQNTAVGKHVVANCAIQNTKRENITKENQTKFATTNGLIRSVCKN